MFWHFKGDAKFSPINFTIKPWLNYQAKRARALSFHSHVLSLNNTSLHEEIRSRGAPSTIPSAGKRATASTH